MCLLITGKSSTVRSVLLNTQGLIADIYQSNADGIGVMYANKDGLKVRKTLPKNALETRTFIEALPTDDREIALHFRWRTHGDINLEQCHPYMISEQVGMMHNGILHTGNHADVSKSDTWHFIEDYLKTLSADVLHDPKLGAMIGEFIEQNKFAIMSGDGRLTVINKNQGIEFDGVWYSNTYAWSPELVDPSYGKKTPYSRVRAYAARRLDDDWGDEDSIEGYDYSGFGAHAVTSRYEESAYDIDFGDLEQALMDLDAEVLAEYLDEVPALTLSYLFQNYKFLTYARTPDKDLTPQVVNIRREIIAGDKSSLFERLETDMSGAMCETIAETFQWYCEMQSLAIREHA